MSFELTQMSYTYLSTYLQCPQKFEWSLVLAIPVPMPWALFYGRCWHEAMARAFIGVKDGGDISGETSQKIAANAFEWWWEKGVTPDFFRGVVNFTDEIDFSGNNPDELKRLGLAMLKSYLIDVAPKVTDVTDVEIVVSQDFDVEGGVMPFVSHLDLITKTSIIDWKTASKPWGKKRRDDDLQSTCYTWQMPDKKFFYHIGVKQYPIEWQVAEIVRTQQQLDELQWEIIPNAVADIRAGIFPARDSWLCPYCGYRDLCS